MADSCACARVACAVDVCDPLTAMRACVASSLCPSRGAETRSRLRRTTLALGSEGPGGRVGLGVAPPPNRFAAFSRRNRVHVRV